MRRFASLVIACSALFIGSSATRAFGEDYYCPPDAKFCPVPGSDQAAAPAMDAPFGFGDAFGGQYAGFESQLNEGERLIMVAPSDGGMAMMPNSAMYAPVADSPYASFVSDSSYASAPGPGGMDMDFIPPPPGSPRPSPSSGQAGHAQQPAARTYRAEPVYDAPTQASARGYQAEPPAAPARREAPEPRLASAAPVRRPARESVKVSGPAARVEPSDSPLKPSPKSFAQSSRQASEYDDYEPESRRPAKTQVAEKPAKKKRADVLSEVANETSRKSDRKSESLDKPSREKKVKKDKKDNAYSDDRVPWWKGGVWRNRNR